MMRPGDVFLTFYTPETEIGNNIDLVLSLGAFLRGPQGIPGPAGSGSGLVQTLVGTAGAPLSGHYVVGLDSTGRFTVVSNTIRNDAFRIAGITNNAANTGDDITVQTQGPLYEAGWNWTPQLPIYLGANGQPTQVIPANGPLFNVPIGVALTSQSMFVRVGFPTFII